MARQTVEISGDARHLEATFDKLAAKQAEQDAGYKENAKTSQGSARQIAADNEAAANKSTASYNRIIRELRKQGPEGRKAAAEVERHLQATGTAGRRDMTSIVDELRRLDPAAAEATRKTEQHIDDAATKGQGAFARFGKSAIGQVTAIAGSFAGITKAIDLVVAGQRKVLDTNREIFEGLKGTAPGDRRLLQVSSSGEDFEQLRGTADRLAADYGIGRDEARNLVFSARSESFEGALDFIASNQQVISTEAQATVGGQVPGLFKGQDFSPEQAINATLAAATESRLSFEDIGRALPGVAASAAPGGATPEETIGALSVFAGRFKSGEQASDRLAALASRMNLDERTAGRGLVGGFEALQGFSAADRQEFLGSSKELNEAYAVFAAESDAINDRIGTIGDAVAATGTDASPVAQRRAAAEADPRLAAQMDVSRSEIATELEREGSRAVGEGERQTQRNRSLQAMEEAGVSPTIIGMAETVDETTAPFGFGMPSLLPNRERAEADANAREQLGLEGLGSPLPEDVQAEMRASGRYPLLSAAPIRGDEPRRPGGAGRGQPPDSDVSAGMMGRSGEQEAPPADTRPRLSAAPIPGDEPRRPGGSGRGQPSDPDGSPWMGRQAEALMRMGEKLDETNKLLRENADASKQTAESSTTTAENTRPRPADPSEAQRGQAAQSDARAPQ